MGVGPSINIDGKQLFLGDPAKTSELQQIFINCTEKEQLIGGAKRGGKSVAISQKAILLSVFFPGNRGFLLREDLTDLRESLLVTFQNICPKELILDHHKTHRRFLMRTIDPRCTSDERYASTIIYSGLAQESADSSADSSKGKECGWFAIDEPSECRKSDYMMYLAQLCWKLPDGNFPPYMAMMGSNPEPGWVEDMYKQLIDRTSDLHRVATDGKRIFIRALPRDNPFLPPGWEAQMRGSADPAWIKKYLDGSWEVSEGQVFKTFDRETHVLDSVPDDYLKTLKLVASLDHAETGITCFCIDGIDPDENVIALAEYYEENRRVSQHAESIKQLCREWAGRCGLKPKEMVGVDHIFSCFDYILIDPSTQRKSLQNKVEMWSIQDEYYRNGVPTSPAWNAIEPGINLVNEYLYKKPQHVHPITKQQGSPSFFILGPFNRNGIREIIGWRRVIQESGKPKYLGKDHWVDNQRYILMSRPSPPRFTKLDTQRLDAQTRMAQRSLAKFDKTFGRVGGENQWFPGGSGLSNQWWPEHVGGLN